MSTITILSAEVCSKRIAKIARVAGALQSEIHQVAVSTLDHIREHGDSTLAARLLGALPNGQRVQALVAWYSTFSNKKATFSYDKANAIWKCKLDPNRADSDFMIDKAAATSYADLNKEKSYKTMTVKGILDFLKKRANEDGLNDDGSPKVEKDARELAARAYAMFKNEIEGVGQAAESLSDLVPDAQ